MRFSRDGDYLATGGQDGIVRVWQLAGAPPYTPPPSAGLGAGHLAKGGPQDAAAVDAWAQSTVQQAAAAADAGSSGAGSDPSGSSSTTITSATNNGSVHGGSAAAAPVAGRVLSPSPFRTFCGHSEDVLDVHWSAAHFLASASIDKSVRLWHVGAAACLRVFWHHDFVTCVRFHPSDLRTLVSGCIDGRVRVWSVPQVRLIG